MGLAFLTTGVAFKIAAVPFHYWTPDAYQGSPTPITGYLSVGPKIGAFALILRLFVRGALAARRLVAAGRHRPGRADDDPRQPRRADPGQRQADAGLQLDRAHRLHARRAGRLRRPARSRASRASSTTRRPYAVHEPRRVRGHRRAPEAARASPRSSTRSPGWAARSRSSRILMTLFLLSLTGIPPTAGFFAQGVRDPRRGRGRRADDAPGRHRGPQRRRRRVLLPARRRLHVHARPGQRRPGAAPRRGWSGAASRSRRRCTILLGLFPSRFCRSSSAAAGDLDRDRSRGLGRLAARRAPSRRRRARRATGRRPAPSATTRSARGEHLRRRG